MTLKRTNKQTEFLRALSSRKYRYLLFGGGVGGGKSYLMAMIFLSMAVKYPKTRYAIFRKNLTTLKRTTYQTFKEVAYQMGVKYKENKNEMFWEVQGRDGISQIWFSELDESKDTDFNKIKSFELTACAIDEANEVNESGFNVLMTRVGRCNANGEHAFIYCSCNPAQNWVKSRFYDKWSSDTLQEPYYFLQALPSDNQFLSDDYIKALEDLPEAEYDRYVKGDWSYSDDPNQLIRFEWIKENLWIPEGEATHMGIDVAREGNDRTIFAYLNEKGLLNYETFNKQDTVETSIKAVERMKEKRIGFEDVAVDVVGVGGGVVDYCRAEGYRVKAFNSGEAPDTRQGHLMFRNRRAEMFWDLREKLQNNNISLPDDAELIKELLAIRYNITDKVIQIEKKSEIKKRVGVSPDIADALVIGMYAQRNTKIVLPIFEI
jgi:phage terminase large subunit